MVEFDPRTIGIAIRKIRKKKNVSQEVFSSFIGITRSHLSLLENGKKKPSLETVWQVANACEILPSELVELIEQESKAQ